MLVEFRIANYRSIVEEQIFSLVASKDAKHPENLIALDGFQLLKAAAIYGANASGKSNLIKAIQFMKDMVGWSATRMNEGDKIVGAVPFLLSSETRKHPCLFEVTLIEEGITYKYGFTATQERVHDEWLSSYLPDGTEQPWFDRRFDPQSQKAEWRFDGPLKNRKRLLQARTRDNSLVLSTGPRENIEPLKRVFQWFRRKLWIFDLSEALNVIELRSAEVCVQNDDVKMRVARLLKDADFQIDGLTIARDEITLAPLNSKNTDGDEVASTFNSPLPASQERSGAEYHGPRLRSLHRMIDSSDVIPFDFDEESNGTQRLFALAVPFLQALDHGAVLFIDELDCSLHPLLTRKLIELFQSQSANSAGAQLVFVTHDSTLLDPELLRRDQIYLAEKNRNQSSEYFSLYDFDTKDRPRNTEAFQRNYLSGRYGGVPQFGATFEDLQLK